MPVSGRREYTRGLGKAVGVEGAEKEVDEVAGEGDEGGSEQVWDEWLCLHLE